MDAAVKEVPSGTAVVVQGFMGVCAHRICSADDLGGRRDRHLRTRRR